MKIKLDENMPNEIAGDLRNQGQDAATVHDQGLSGTDDAALLAHIQAEQRAFWTMDKGVADVRVYPPNQYPGIILFRVHTTGRRAVLEFVRRHLQALLQIDPSGRLVVVSDAGIRIR